MNYTATVNLRPVSQPPCNPEHIVVLFGGKHKIGVDRFRNRHPDRTHWCERSDFPAVRQPTQEELDREAYQSWRATNPYSGVDAAFYAGLRKARS